MSKYILGEAHSGNPEVVNRTLADSTLKKSEILGYAFSINSEGKMEKDNTTKEFYGVGTGKRDGNSIDGSVEITKKGDKILVITNGTATIGSAVYVDNNGKFTSTETSNQLINAVFVGQDDVDNAEILEENTALIDLK